MYDDEVPEPITDFKVEAPEDDPGKMLLKFSECSSDDVQGYMAFATKDPKNKDFTSYKAIDFDGQTANFTVGDKLTGGTSGATGYIVSIKDDGATGTVILANVVGTFVNNDALTDEHTGDGSVNGSQIDLPAWGWVDAFDSVAKTITCAGMAANWQQDCWNGFKLIMTNGRNRGKVYTVADTGHETGVLTLTETITKGEFGYNDMFILVRDYNEISDDVTAYGVDVAVYALETNRGFFLERAPDDDYEVWVVDMEQLPSNEKWYIFVQAIDNLSMGENGDKSNLIQFVRPSAYAFKIRDSETDLEGGNLTVFKDCYVDLTGLGAMNTEDQAKGFTKMEAFAGEYRFLSNTYTTVLTVLWNAGTTITLDLSDVPHMFFKPGQRVVITDGTNAVIRTILSVGDDSIVVDAASTNPFAIGSVAYITKEFQYGDEGPKVTKARIINEYGFASSWRTIGTAPDPESDSGLASLKVEPTEVIQTTDTVYFNMAESFPKSSNQPIVYYYLDMDDGSGITAYETPVQEGTYATTGTKEPWMYILDNVALHSPSFALVWDKDAGGYTDVTLKAKNGTTFTPLANAGEILYMGSKREIDKIYFNLTVAWNTLVYTIEYSKGGGVWGTLSVSDGTVNLTQDGVMEFDRPDDWDVDSVNSSDDLFWIRITVTSVTAGGTLYSIVPIEKGENLGEVTVLTNVIIDLNSTDVLQDQCQKFNRDRKRASYQTEGIATNKSRPGNLGIPSLILEGHAHTIGDNYIDGFDASGVPTWGGAPNTQNRRDDIQVIEKIMKDNRLVQWRDDNGNVWVGWLEMYTRPQRITGDNKFLWRVTLNIDLDRSTVV